MPPLSFVSPDPSLVVKNEGDAFSKEEAQPAEIGGYVRVVPFAHVDQSFWYSVPSPMQANIGVGRLIKVPLGRQVVFGIIVEQALSCPTELGYLKAVKEVVQPAITLRAELLALGQWISRYYAAPLGLAFERLVPPVAHAGMALKEEKVYFRLANLEAPELEKLQKRSPRQALVYQALYSAECSLASLKAAFQAVEGPLKALLDKGIVGVRQQVLQRRPYLADGSQPCSETSTTYTLTAEQKNVVEKVIHALEQKSFQAYLLQGITGSGKTLVYEELVRSVLASGGSVIVLVPEIALAPQMVTRLQAILEGSGYPVQVWHSHLSQGERFDAWKALLEDRPTLLIGARSAILAPIYNLKLIVVDEEHEPAYKQEQAPRYHARDVAVYRAKLNDAVCVLGSATPSLESYYNVQKGKYQLLQMLSRIDGRSLPRIQIVDMRHAVKAGKTANVLISQVLLDKLRERFQNQEQSILFINRRGYAATFLCAACGHIEACSYCSVHLTYHKVGGCLKCHWCGFQKAMGTTCPKCSAKAALNRSFGTQKMESVVSQLVPGAKVVRLDSDSMQSKKHFWDQLKAFRSGNVDILIGTQVLAKGLDFPAVTLVGVLEADLSLHMQDFRASERTFQLLVQVAGRAGRGNKPGEVVIQTFLPQNSAIQLARSADYEGFFQAELQARAEYGYPPFQHIIRHLLEGKNKEKVTFCAAQWAQALKASFGGQITLRGPVAAPIEKIKDRYRFQLLLFVEHILAFLPRLLELRKQFSFPAGVCDRLDVDALDLS